MNKTNVNEEHIKFSPRGWIWTQLCDILGFVKGKKPINLGPEIENRKILYINIDAFENKVFEKYTDSNNCPLCKSDDILIVWDGARCGLVGRGVSGVIGSTLAKLIVYETDKSYLFYFLNSKFAYINKRPRGVGIPHIEPDIFWNIEFPLAPLPEQHRIVTKIEELFTKLDAGIKALKTIKAQLKHYRQAVLKYAFEGKLTKEWRELHKDEIEPATKLLERMNEERKQREYDKYKELPAVDKTKLFKLPEGWVWTSLESIIKITSGFAFKGSDFIANGVPVIKIANVGYGVFINKIQEYLSTSYLKKYDDYIVEPGVVLLTLTRPITKDTVKVCKYPDNTPIGLLNQRVAMLKSYWKRMNSYLFLFTRSTFFKNIINIRMSQTLQPNLSPRVLRGFPIPISSELELSRIVEEIEQRFSLADEIEKTVDASLIQSERLRKSILKRAFEGKLVPQDLSDEPAEKLLERIRLQKAEILTKRR